MRLYISGQEEKETLIHALCEYVANHESESAVKILARAVKCSELQNRRSKKKAVTPKNESND